jgi:hypothetical protein
MKLKNERKPKESRAERERDPEEARKSVPMGFWGLGFDIVFLLFSLWLFSQGSSKEKVGCAERMKSAPSKELRQ